MQKFFGFFIMLCISNSLLAQQLFNGNDLSGWQHVSPGNFVVENHLLKTQGGMGVLWYTKQKFGNVRIHVVYKTNDAEANSGIFFRIANPPKSIWDAVHHGYEAQICDAGEDAFDAFHHTGAIYSFSPATSLAANSPGKWNVYDIELRGDKVVIFLNHQKVNDFQSNDTSPARKFWYEPKRGPRPVVGYIGIQNHDHNKKPGTHVYFKEISIHPLESA